MITAEQIKQEVIRLGTEYPQAKYIRPTGKSFGPCYYDEGKVINGPEGERGCIFGQALRNLGMKENLNKLMGIRELLSIMNIPCSDELASRFTACQYIQDQNCTWGNAISEFSS